jgi:hypothetical protein
MTEFLEKTWLIWWIVAAFAILRWFHFVSADGGAEVELQAADFEHDGMPSCGSAS